MLLYPSTPTVDGRQGRKLTGQLAWCMSSIQQREPVSDKVEDEDARPGPSPGAHVSAVACVYIYTDLRTNKHQKQSDAPSHHRFSLKIN